MPFLYQRFRIATRHYTRRARQAGGRSFNTEKPTNHQKKSHLQCAQAINQCDANTESSSMNEVQPFHDGGVATSSGVVNVLQGQMKLSVGRQML